jgi:gluconolactonase
MAPDRGCLSLVSADGSTITRVARTGRPNAVVVDGDGHFWVAESYPHPALLRLSPSGEVLTSITECVGLALLFPNDLVFAPDGCLYLTDSGIGLDDWAPGGTIRDDYHTAAIDGRVFRIDIASGEAELVDRGIAFANGIAVDRDGDLFANEMVTGEVFRYSWDSSRQRFGTRVGYANVLEPGEGAEHFAGPDGMTFAGDGRLFCTIYGSGRVAVIDATGNCADSIATAGRNPTNASLGRGTGGRLFVTECELGQLEVFDVDAAPVAIYEPSQNRTDHLQ